MARHHDVWVLTRGSNRLSIEPELLKSPVPGLHVTYHDVDLWPERRSTQAGVETHYYLWQKTAHTTARALHQRVGFDLAHHATYVRYWMPTALADLDIPFVWGPVGGGESPPASFYGEFDRAEWGKERLRDAVRWLGERDPAVRRAARRCRIALATTQETRDRLAALGVADVRTVGETALPESEVRRLGALPCPPPSPLRFISVGRLLHWKGFQYGLRAFAEADLPAAEYWVVGAGPERGRLEALARNLGIADRVTFFGALPRDETLQKLSACHVLVHPSLHDSGGWVCLEAMSARRPVLCFDLGGPGVQVSDQAGFKVRAVTPPQAVGALAARMRMLHEHPDLLRQMGEAGHARVRDHFVWEAKARHYSAVYAEAVGLG